MAINQTIKDRLIFFIKSLSIGQGAFEKQVGLSNGYVNNIRVSIQPDKLQKIALHFPQLNTGWLMTGEGDMLHTEQVVQSGDCASLTEIIKIQAQTIQQQNKFIMDHFQNGKDPNFPPPAKSGEYPNTEDINKKGR